MRAVLIAIALMIASPSWAFEPSSTGVVLIHGKWGRPNDPNIAP